MGVRTAGITRSIRTEGAAEQVCGRVAVCVRVTSGRHVMTAFARRRGPPARLFVCSCAAVGHCAVRVHVAMCVCSQSAFADLETYSINPVSISRIRGRIVRTGQH